MKIGLTCLALALLAAFTADASASITVVFNHNENQDATPAFDFRSVPRPAKTGLKGKFTLIDGEMDANAGGLDALSDGQTPAAEDAPDDNFFFAAGTSGGRLRLDLSQVKTIQEIRTYSWHPGARGPQVYKLYGADGASASFNPAPGRETDPAACGWTLIASVDTRPTNGEPGGQYGVRVSDAGGPVGQYRYLLFDCSAAETGDAFGNTFYSEINVLGPGDADSAETNAADLKPFVAHTADGKYEITIETSRAPDLTEWATNKLAPVLLAWYPKIVALLPSEGFQAPARFRVILRPGRGVADTAGTRVTAYAPWIRRELNGQAIGSVVHECVHVVQQYGEGRRDNPHPAQNPGYLVEGMADYVRWYLYEPQSNGAEISRRGLERANYDGSYRVTANFLNWVATKYDKDIIPRLNAAMREGHYGASLWTKATGKTVEQLNLEWKDGLKKKIRPNA